MKTMSKKIASILLALCLCFSLVGTALAATSSEGGPFTITVNGAADGETYSAYKIFDVTYDTEADAYSYTIDSNSAWYSIVAAATDVFTLTQVNGSTTYNVSVNEGVEDDAVIAVFTEAGVPDGAEAAASERADGDTVVLDVTDSGPGYYYVTTTLGSLVIIDTTDPSPVIEEKNGIPTISKWVYNTEDGENEHEDHENNNTQVTYELDVENITGAVNLVIHDSQPSELDEDWTEFHPTVVLVDGTRTTLEENVDYSIVLTGAVEGGEECSDPAFTHECTFEINFTGYDFSNVSESAYIEVIYTATLKTEGDIYSDDMDEIDNWAVVSYGNNSTSAEAEAEVYSFGFEIFKYTDEYDGAYSEVIVAPFYNDSPNADVPFQDNLYLMLVDADGNVTNYATFEELDTSDGNYIYVITGWVTDEDEASYITEPEYGTATADDPYYAYFYVPSDMNIPEHAQIQLDEDPSNPDEEDNDAAEILGAAGYGQPLAGAQFEVTNENGQTAYFLYETDQNVYLFEGWLDAGASLPEGSDYTTALTSATDGMIYIDGLDTGTYTVTETAAPDGYNLLTGTITVIIEATYDPETGAIITHTVTYTYGETSGEGTVEVENNTGSRLPNTGGIGTTIFYIIGGILVVGAVVVLVTRRRMTSES